MVQAWPSAHNQKISRWILIHPVESVVTALINWRLVGSSQNEMEASLFFLEYKNILDGTWRWQRFDENVKGSNDNVMTMMKDDNYEDDNDDMVTKMRRRRRWQRRHGDEDATKTKMTTVTWWRRCDDDEDGNDDLMTTMATTMIMTTVMIIELKKFMTTLKCL